MNINGLDSKDLSGIFDRYDIKESRKDLEEFLKSWDGVGDISQSYQKWMADNGKATSTFSSITQKAGTALKSFGAALGSMGVMWAISEVIGFVVTGLHSLATASETARENAAGLAKSISSFNENISNNSSKISDLNSRYQELSKGVNNLGENISLSSSEYDEYKNIISQVSDIMPDLTTYFNSQGEAIGFTYRKRATKKYIDYSFCVCK